MQECGGGLRICVHIARRDGQALTYFRTNKSYKKIIPYFHFHLYIA